MVHIVVWQKPAQYCKANSFKLQLGYHCICNVSFAEHNSEELGGRIIFNYITAEEIGISGSIHAAVKEINVTQPKLMDL